MLVTCRRGGSASIPGVEFGTFDADLSRNDPESLERIRRFSPHVAILAFGVGLTPVEGVREVMLTNGVYPAEVASWLYERAGCRCVVQMGSCFEYGHPESGTAFSESSPLRPFNLYGASKVASCLALKAFAETSGSQVLYLRPFTVFGPGEPRTRLAPTLFDAALDRRPAHFSDGLQKRDFVYADDLGGFVAHLLTVRERLGGWQVLNVCSGQGTRVKDFVLGATQVLATRFGTEPSAVYFDLERKWKNEPDSVVGDPTNACELLGWSCRWRLEDAIFDYFQQYVDSR